MNEIIVFFGTIITAAGALFLAVLAGTFFGALGSWCVGLVFIDTFVVLKDFLGVTCTNFELGAALGFVGGFFRTISK